MINVLMLFGLLLSAVVVVMFIASTKRGAVAAQLEAQLTTLLAEAERLRDETGQAHNSAAATTSLYEDLLRKHASLNDENIRLRTSVSDSACARSQANEKVIAAQTELYYANQKLARLSAELKKAQEQTLSREQASNAIAAQLTTLLAEAERLRDEAGHAHNSAAATTSLYEDLLRKHASLNDENIRLRTSVSDSTCACLKAKEEAIAVQTELYSANQKLARLRAELATAQEQMLGREQAASAIEAQYGPVIALGDELGRLRSAVNELSTAKEHMKQEYEAGRQTYEALKKEALLLEETIELHSFGLYKPNFDFVAADEYKTALEDCYYERKQLVDLGDAIPCTSEWSINNSIVQGRMMTKRYSKIMLRAFNGECDAAISNVKWNNIRSMEERIKKSFKAINDLGESHNIRIQDVYFDIRMKELRLTYELQDKVRAQKEEQRRIRDQMREEQRAIQEIEVTREKAEKGEAWYTKALQQARSELAAVHDGDSKQLKARIADLENSLQKASSLKERAISMAQITKAGYVYVISNIGSFGENVYKIGMTRRIEPSERIRELGGASVPFGFDVHALIFSKDAPELESRFHKRFRANQLNLANERKEFFKVSLDEIEQFARDNEFSIEFTRVAEARNYRETLAMRAKMSDSEIESELDRNFPQTLFGDTVEAEPSYEEEQAT